MRSDISEISIENIEKVLEYLSYFEDANNDICKGEKNFGKDIIYLL